ncbi:MAG: arylsulfatase [Terriglobales bacterium]
MAKPFQGVINFDVRESVHDWTPYLPPQAKPGSPNILYVIFDDTGIAAWDTFGGLIEMPNVNRIQKLGLRFTNWHTTALCSPTRSCLLTGRNASMNGMACITEGSDGFPSLSALVPPENGMLPEMLLENGYSTFCIGKWHLAPANEGNLASSRRAWPTGRGFERYYGFLGGETNQWYPELTYDNHPVPQPALPEEGYHLSKDLVDRSVEFIRDSVQVDPQKPWLLYLAFGANHAPHHVPKEWADRYKGKFDMGYEKYREMVLERMKRLGVAPGSTQLSPINPWPAPEVILPGDLVRPWDKLGTDEKRLFSRMAEVYAGFSSYTDHQLGRLLDYLEESDQLENTVVVVVSDNGASGEGSPNGSVNENKFFNGWPDDLKGNLSQLDQLGSPETYNHYPTGWAWAFNTPYKMFKRYSLEGGIADPLVIAWPKEMRAVAGQNRDQYHHAIDVVPTLLECVGIEPPTEIKGYTQSPLQGVSMRYCFAEGKAQSRRERQLYSMLGTRAIYAGGWKAVARHGAISGKGHFMDDAWELYNLESDRAETQDLAAQFPEKLKEMTAAWFALAGANQAFPLDDRTAIEIISVERPLPGGQRNRFVYYPHTTGVPEAACANIRNRSYSILAEVELDRADAEGVLMSQGSRFGGHTLYVKGGKLCYLYNFLGIEETRIVAGDKLSPGKAVLAAEFTKTGENPRGVANGTLRLYVNDKVVGEGKLRTQPGMFGLSGTTLCVGQAGPDRIAKEIEPPFAFTGGTIKQVTVSTSGEQYKNLELEAMAALARE